MPLPLVEECRGCERAIDVRCPYHRKYTTHHRVIDCVVPMYGGMAAQLQSWRLQRPDAQACLVGEPGVMFAFARALLPPLAGLR